MGTNTPNFSLYKPTVGETGWGSLVDANFDTIDSNMLSGGLPRSYLAGLGLAPSGSPTFVLSVAAGQAADVANAGAISLAAAITKDLSGAWSVGSGNGGRGTGVAYSASTWYHVFVIKRTDTNVVDAYFDTSASAANIPAPYTLFRRLGSVRTDGAKNIIQFTQDGDYFRWAADVRDVSAGSTGPVSATLTVPTGVNVMAWGNCSILRNVGSAGIYISDLAANDEAPTITGSTTFNVWSDVALAGYSAASPWQCRTNTSAQVRYRNNTVDAGATCTISTFGWNDRRGRDA